MIYSVEKDGANFTIKRNGVSLISVPSYSDALMFASTLETETEALRRRVAELETTVTTQDNRITEQDAALIRYRDYALKLQYALKRAGLSIEVDDVPVPNVEKLEGDLAAAQNIIIEAGKKVAEADAAMGAMAVMMVEKNQRVAELEAENARMKDAIENALEALSPYLNANSPYTPDVLEAAGYLNKATAPDASATPELSFPLPKYAVNQPVWVVHNYGHEFGLSNKAANVVEIKQEDGANWYRVKYVHGMEEGTQWWEEYEILPRENNDFAIVTATAEQVTLTDKELEWLAWNYVPMSDDFRAYPSKIIHTPHCVVYLGETKDNMQRYQLVPEKRTTANMEAIKKSREDLLGQINN